VLTDIKKAGVLGKDVVLRKTTFDECKGDRFEELLAGFASLVLRQRLSREKRGLPDVQRHPESRHVPLVLALKSSLRANLEKRQAIRNKLLAYEQEASDRRDRLLQAKAILQRHKALDSNVRNRIETDLREAWTTDPAWIAALTQGMPSNESLVRMDDVQADDHEPDSVLRGLSSLAKEQEDQLRRWQAFSSSLSKNNSKAHDGRSSKAVGNLRLIFDKHQLAPIELTSSNREQDANYVKKRHKELLQRLSQELAADVSNSRADLGSRTAQNMPSAQNRQCELALDQEQPITTQAHVQENPQQPPNSQPGYLPQTNADSPPMQPASGEDQSTDHYDVQVTSRENKLQSPESSLTPVHLTLASPPQSVQILAASDEAEEPISPLVHKHDANSRPSLHERTRMSLAGVFRENDNNPTSPAPMYREQLDPVEEDSRLCPTRDEYSGDLVQRTRKSMSLLTTIADMKTSRRKSKGPRVSQLYPVNPFETPRKTSLQVGVNTPGSNDSTPREKLFSDDADMSSVFKSRPKIALSPMISPDRSLIEADSILASRASDLYLDEASDADSNH
jgi:hypothetical protein